MTTSSPNAAKVKVAILLVNRQFIRSWIDSGLIKHLEANGNFEVHIFSDTDIYKRLPASNDYKTVNLGVIKISILLRWGLYKCHPGLKHFDSS